jgi:sterol desaturase/sphingolipid hydroxylase (fatty acid hydroxylase superfamily)
MDLKPLSYICWCIIVIGYMVQNLALEYCFYYCKRKSLRWKIQPNKKKSVGRVFGPPFLDWFRTKDEKKPGRAKFHSIFATINILVAGTFAFTTCELSLRNKNYMYFQNFDIVVSMKELIFGILWQSVLEYWWHILMHVSSVYHIFHKHHHYYKSPEPFDDLYIHPLESAGYYCILYSMPFVMQCHVYSFLAYMVIIGIFGVVDHSGIKVIINVPFTNHVIYDSEDHDIHHQMYNKNYAFPFPWLDKIHETYFHR